MDYLKLNVIPLEQKIGTFFLTKMKPEDILFTSRTDLSRYENAETGVQRNISKQRQNEIRKYILNDNEATFPNSIIISITNDFSDLEQPNYYFDEEADETEVLKLNILKTENIASILDGQHRMSGFKGGVDFNFDIPVSIFLDAPLSTKAKIFAKVNGTQVKVPNDLVYDLFGITKQRSTEKTAFSIVKHLNDDADSPWRNGIKTLTDRDGFISQGAFAKYIDKHLISEGKPLRKLYDENRDADILQILKNYFSVVSNEFSSYWATSNKKIILQKTTGFTGLMKFFNDIVFSAKEKNELLNIETFSKYVRGVSVNLKELDNDNYPAGAKGQNKFYKDLVGIKDE